MKVKDNYPRTIGRETVPTLGTPSGTETWQPVSHDFVLSLVENAIAGAGMQFSEDYHYVSHGDLRYMGRLIINRGEGKRDLVVGLINTHDKSEAAKVLAGVRYNGTGSWKFSFFTEISIRRKHTKNILTNFPAKVAEATSMILKKFETLDQRYDQYEQFALTSEAAHDLVIKMLDATAYPASAITKVLKAYRAAKVETAFGLFDAVNTVLNEGENPFTLPERTHALHGVLDQAVGYQAAEGNRLINMLAI